MKVVAVNLEVVVQCHQHVVRLVDLHPSVTLMFRRYLRVSCSGSLMKFIFVFFFFICSHTANNQSFITVVPTVVYECCSTVSNNVTITFVDVSL